jgi:hypothetical protein
MNMNPDQTMNPLEVVANHSHLLCPEFETNVCLSSAYRFAEKE